MENLQFEQRFQTGAATPVNWCPIAASTPIKKSKESFYGVGAPRCSQSDGSAYIKGKGFFFSIYKLFIWVHGLVKGVLHLDDELLPVYRLNKEPTGAATPVNWCPIAASTPIKKSKESFYGVGAPRCSQSDGSAYIKGKGFFFSIYKLFIWVYGLVKGVLHLDDEPVYRLNKEPNATMSSDFCDFVIERHQTEEAY